MKHFLPSLILLLSTASLFCQQWVDTTYTIQTESDLFYGTARGFAGATDSLFLDLSYPTNDVAPVCGRPLMIMVHGGAFIGGNKNEGYPPRIREDFAKRGYTTASIQYRLGQIHTNQFINCNVPLWNCYNMTDSSEWYRAYYRGIQDVHGALRYLINRSEDYQIDPNNVFIVGESAGGFIAMGVGFLDQEEVLADLVAEYPDAPVPNQLYESPCIQTFSLANNIAEMDLTRPALGSYEGTLNLPLNKPYHIQAVGNLYGGVFNNIFTTNTVDPPALYLYHQPCDLIVPYRRAKVLAGYVNCLLGFPTNCSYVVNRPIVYGSLGIKQMIDTLVVNGVPTSAYLFDNSNNNYNCLQQASNPAMGCHAIDNYWLRTTNMAAYFAGYLDTCAVSATNNPEELSNWVRVYPNPANGVTTIEFSDTQPSVSLVVINALGQIQHRQTQQNCRTITLTLTNWQPGFYQLFFDTGSKPFSRKLVVIEGH
jgi:acetyl esterase/lipase